MPLSAPAQAPLPFPFLITFHLSPVPGLKGRGLQLWLHQSLPCNTYIVWLRVESSANLRWLEELVQSLLQSRPWIHTAQ